MRYPEPNVEIATSRNAVASAAEKVAVGALLNLNEAAAFLGVAPGTVHGLPLPSIRLGKLLRFDPVDVRRLIESCKEPTVAPPHHEVHIERQS
jgi:hypothetical protein